MNRLLQIQSNLISSTSLDPHELKTLLFTENYKNREFSWQMMRNNKVYHEHFHLHDYSIEEIRKKTLAKLAVTWRNTPQIEEVRKLNFEVANPVTLFCNGVTYNDINFCILGGVHSFLYLKSIHLLGTQKHHQTLMKAINYQQLGCFGLTELSHGSNVKGILTEAHYDHINKQFVIDSPIKEAMKFWIGGAGKHATKSVIWAQLYIDGKNYGVHAFIVPLRDPQTHKLLAGVLAGDCGPKGGLNGVDNGYILFDKVRISKDNLLDRISGVDDQGKFRTLVKNEDKRFGLHLGALSGGRFFVATNCAALSLQALTIAIRYANERRQFKGPKDEQEKRLIEYPMMKRRLMPLLAANLVYHRASMYHIAESDKNIQKFMDVKDPIIEKLHAISSVMKAKTSWFAAQCIQQCRQAMGGHGYSSYSKMGTIYNDNDINLTWQGDNHVLVQQTSKYVLEQAQKAIQKGQASNNPVLQFLTNPPDQMPEFNRENLTSLEKGLIFLQFKLMRKIEETGMRMLQLKNRKLPLMEIWNNSQVFKGREVAIIFGDIALLTHMIEAVAQAKNKANKDLLQTAARLWMLSVYRNDQFVEMTYHPLIETLIAEDCIRMQKVSLELLRIIGPDDVVTGSPFADPNGQGINKYLQIILSKPTNQRVEWWDILLQR